MIADLRSAGETFFTLEPLVHMLEDLSALKSIKTSGVQINLTYI